MDIKKLEALSEIVACGSFCKTAEKLNYSQPGLTGMINRLEDELGLALLIRSSKGVKLTESGKELMPLIQEILQAYEKFDTALYRSKKKKETIIYIGAYASITTMWLLKAITALRKDYSSVDVIVKNGTAPEILQWLEDGSVDIALISKPSTSGNEWTGLKKDRYYAVLPRGTAGAASVFPIKDFVGQKFLMPGMGADSDIWRVLLDNKVAADISHISVEDPTILSMVEQGLGVSMLSQLGLEAWAEGKAIDTLPLAPDMYRELGIVLKSTKNITLEMKKLISYIKKAVE